MTHVTPAAGAHRSPGRPSSGQQSSGRRGLRRRLLGRRLIGCLLVIATATACTPDGSGRPAAPQPSLAVSVSQPRQDEGTRTLRAAITNAGPGTVTVTSATLDWPGFEPRAAAVDAEPLAPGDIVGFSLQHGEPRCPADHEAAPAVAAVVDGTELSLPIEDDDAAVVRRLHTRACAQHRLDRTAGVELDLGDRIVTHRGEEYLPGHVVVRRRPGTTTTVAVVELTGSVLLRLATARVPLPVTVGPSVAVARIPVRVTSTRRCDAHALSNSSQTFLFGVHVRLGRHPAQRVVRFPDTSEKRRLTTLLDRACGSG